MYSCDKLAVSLSSRSLSSSPLSSTYRAPILFYNIFSLCPSSLPNPSLAKPQRACYLQGTKTTSTQLTPNNLLVTMLSPGVDMHLPGTVSAVAGAPYFEVGVFIVVGHCGVSCTSHHGERAVTQ
jgi:hypothetical protein